MIDEKKKIGDITKIKYSKQPTKTKKIINQEEYITNGEYLLIVKDIDNCEIILNYQTTESIKIKSFTKTTIIPLNSLIDNIYEIVEIDNGASIELEYYEGNWYIVSSDGIKY